MAEPDQGKDYKSEWLRERERLAKLWAAFEGQEKELRTLRDKVFDFERTIAEKERLLRSLKDLVEARDRTNRNYELELTSSRQAREDYEPKLKEINKELQIEKARFAKLFALAEDLDEELRRRQREIEIRDEWFRTNVDVLRRVDHSIQEWDRMLQETRERTHRPAYKATLERLSKDSDDPTAQMRNLGP